LLVTFCLKFFILFSCKSALNVDIVNIHVATVNMYAV
jgi:hypothetical protein